MLKPVRYAPKPPTPINLPAVKVKPPVVQPPLLRKAPNGLFYNSQGKLVNKHNQLVNDKGHRINDAGQLINKHGQAINDKGKLINAQNHTINARGALVNDDGHLVDSQNRLINSAGRLVNPKGDYVDKDQKVVNKEGYLIDAQKRPLDKDGKVARDMTTAVKGNNEPHEHFFSPALKSKIHSWQGKEPAPSSPKTSTVAEVAQRMADADKLVKSGVISKSPGYGQLAREGGISAGITGVVSAPINVAAYSGSVLAGEAIKAAYNPAPLTPPPPVAPKVAGQPAGSPEAPSAELPTEEEVALQALYPQINKAQINAFAAANLSIALKFGDDEKGYIPDPTWPPDALGRLESIERLLDFAEEHTHGLAEEKRVHFRAYVRKEALPEGAAGFAAQVETIERRIEEIKLSHDEVLAKLGKLKPKQEPS